MAKDTTYQNLTEKEREELFTLKVRDIVYNILEERSLTIEEINKIKAALKETLDILFSSHKNNCKEERKKDFWKMVPIATAIAVCIIKTIGLILELLSKLHV